MKKSKEYIGLFYNLLTIGENNLSTDIEKFIPCINSEFAGSILNEYLRNNVFHTALISVKQPVYVVGDLHGDLFDLLRILNRNGLPLQTNYLFLGDYIDRGQYPVQTLLLLIALHNVYPTNISLLRGNHEIPSVCEQYGFKEKVLELLGDENLMEAFYTVFSYLPLAGIVDNRYFCVHGGISKNLTSLSNLLRLEMPILEITPLVEDLLWSDPANSEEMYLPSARNKGHQFGAAATERFLNSTKLSYIIRAHSYILNGATIFHSAKVISIFSSSHYVEGGNVATIIYLDGVHVFEKLYPAKYLKVADSSLVPINFEKKLAATTILKPIIRPKPRHMTPKYRATLHI